MGAECRLEFVGVGVGGGGWGVGGGERGAEPYFCGDF